MQSPDSPSQSDHSDSPDDDEIQEYFVSGIDVDDVTSLWNLNQRYALLDAFTTIFRGEPTGVIVRLHVLLEMSDRPAGTTSWGLSELRHHFSYLTDTAFDTVMRRLRGGGLISYDRESNSYTATSLGLQVASSISYFLKGYEEEGLTLLTGVLFAGDAMGNISGADLSHLLNRLGQLEQELQGAIDSASEPAILSARGRFDAVWKRIEQGTDIIKRIAQNQNMDRETHKLGQKVAQAQSRLARVTTTFQRAMNDIDRQRVHLGNSGISTSDLNRYLMTKTQEELISIFDGAMGISIQPILLLTDVLSDVAEYELVERQREEKEEWKLPQPVDSSLEESALEEDIPHLKELIEDVVSLREESPLKVIVPKECFELSSYILSMLFLVDDASAAQADGPLSELVKLPLDVYVQNEVDEVGVHGVHSISKGVVKKRGL
jgi:hypothetical protein